MAKVISAGSILSRGLDCGHYVEVHGFLKQNAYSLSPGDEVHCQVCADIEKRVKAARVDALKEMRQELVHVNFKGKWRAIQDTFDGIIDKLIEATK